MSFVLIINRLYYLKETKKKKRNAITVKKKTQNKLKSDTSAAPHK